jgi:hypothetical protein
MQIISLNLGSALSPRLVLENGPDGGPFPILPCLQRDNSGLKGCSLQNRNACSHSLESVCASQRVTAGSKFPVPGIANAASEHGSLMLSRLRSLRAPALDFEFLHFINERCARQAEPRGRAVLTTNKPIGLFKHLQNVFAFSIGERVRSCCRRLSGHMTLVKAPPNAQ